MFKSRLISGIVLLILAFITVITGGYLLAAVLWLISMVAFRELCLACKVQKENKEWNELEITGYTVITLYYGIMVFLVQPLYLVLMVLFGFISFLFIF